MSKRGISPLIATVLIIGFTIILAAMVITWGSKLFHRTIEDSSEQSNLAKLQSNLDFDIETTRNENNSNLVNVKIRNKNQDIEIMGFVFLAKSNQGAEVFVAYNS